MTEGAGRGLLRRLEGCPMLPVNQYFWVLATGTYGA
jgi:hypothetical protein